MSRSRFTPGAATGGRTRRLRRIWKALTPEERVQAVQAAGQDRGTGYVAVLRSQVAQALKLRPVTVQGWSVDKLLQETLRAPLGEEVLSDLLIAFHLSERVALLSAFLDAAGVPHTDGAMEPGADAELDEARIEAAADAVSANFPEHACQVYFATLVAMEGGPWTVLEKRLDESLAG